MPDSGGYSSPDRVAPADNDDHGAVGGHAVRRTWQSLSIGLAPSVPMTRSVRGWSGVRGGIHLGPTGGERQRAPPARADVVRGRHGGRGQGDEETSRQQEP